MLLPFSSSLAKKAARQSCSVTTGPQNQLKKKTTSTLQKNLKENSKYLQFKVREPSAQVLQAPFDVLHDKCYPPLRRISFSTGTSFYQRGLVCGRVEFGQVFLSRNGQRDILEVLQGHRHLTARTAKLQQLVTFEFSFKKKSVCCPSLSESHLTASRCYKSVALQTLTC